ncbi:hypothetical protein BC937DRAFT_89708 [Endogone sp. FLAS-F59071]|nr:hypothetical protein BC937DRAFT_89708 [Endogone sp. FLAS-F59071]|eukprot:RUS17623.1 hypothetical protein BC937DRAFT_89708 [Endogone sp. FLAS-F59071]
MATTKHEERAKFLQNVQNPRPVTFFNRFPFRKKSTANRDYAFCLDIALRRDSESETLLRTKRMWDAGEFNDDWSEFEDIKANRKVNRQVKKRKRQAHAVFHSHLDDALDGGYSAAATDVGVGAPAAIVAAGTADALGTATATAEAQVDVDTLHEASISDFPAVQPMTEEDWEVAMDRIESYRKALSKERRLHDPLYYYIIDHSGQHGPTTDLLNEHLPSMRLSLPKEVLPTQSDEHTILFDQLFAAKHPDDVPVKTDEERRIRGLVVNMYV